MSIKLNSILSITDKTIKSKLTPQLIVHPKESQLTHKSQFKTNL